MLVLYVILAAGVMIFAGGVPGVAAVLYHGAFPLLCADDQTDFWRHDRERLAVGIFQLCENLDGSGGSDCRYLMERSGLADGTDRRSLSGKNRVCQTFIPDISWA